MNEQSLNVIFDEMSADTKGLQELWSQIKDTIQDSSEYNHNLIEKVDIDELPWAESTVKGRILVDLRNELEEQGVIRVVKEKGEGSTPRKKWVLDIDEEDE